MTTRLERLPSTKQEIRPSKDFQAFIARLQAGLDFTKRQTSTWSIEDWELAVDAGAADLQDTAQVSTLSLLEDCSGDEIFSGHGFWILFAIAYLRGRAAYHAGFDRNTPPFRTEQLQYINIPNSMSVIVTAQFKLGFDAAAVEHLKDSRNTVPEWVERALSLPLARSRAERSSGRH